MSPVVDKCEMRLNRNFEAVGEMFDMRISDETSNMWLCTHENTNYFQVLAEKIGA